MNSTATIASFAQAARDGQLGAVDLDALTVVQLDGEYPVNDLGDDHEKHSGSLIGAEIERRCSKDRGYGERAPESSRLIEEDGRQFVLSGKRDQCCPALESHFLQDKEIGCRMQYPGNDPE